jgi:hypothetical protein
MITSNKTRFLLGGKVMDNLASVEIHWVPNEEDIKVIFFYKGNFLDLELPGTYKLLGIDTVEENQFDKNKETVTWTQFIVEKVNDTNHN